MKLSLKTRLITALILGIICLLMVLCAYFSHRWFVVLFISPVIYLLYDVSFSKYMFTEDGIIIRTGQYITERRYKWKDFKNVKIDRFYPWGRIALIKKDSNKVVYLYCDNPVVLRKIIAQAIEKDR